jgi:hypothetical protein
MCKILFNLKSTWQKKIEYKIDNQPHKKYDFIERKKYKEGIMLYKMNIFKKQKRQVIEHAAFINF